MPWVTAPKLKADAGHQGILTGTANVTLFPDMGQRRAATMKAAVDDGFKAELHGERTEYSER
jgi:hypothetical protein